MAVKPQVIVVSVAILLGGCFDGEVDRMQTHWLSPLKGYDIDPLAIFRDSGSGGEQPVNHNSQYGIAYMRDLGLRVSISQASYPTGFWLDIKNENDHPIRILWPGSRYVDETGEPHAIYAQPMNPLPSPDVMQKGTPPTLLEPGAHINYVLAPIYKATIVQYDAYERGSHHSHLIPTDLMNLRRFPDEASIKTYVADLAERQVPIRLVLPIESDGKQYEYTFTFVVRKR